jgi:hypothetical protein
MSIFGERGRCAALGKITLREASSRLDRLTGQMPGVM